MASRVFIWGQLEIESITLDWYKLSCFLFAQLFMLGWCCSSKIPCSGRISPWSHWCRAKISSITDAPCPELSLQCPFFNLHTTAPAVTRQPRVTPRTVVAKIFTLFYLCQVSDLIHHPPESRETTPKAGGQHSPSSCSTSEPAAELLPSGKWSRWQNIPVFKGLERPE